MKLQTVIIEGKKHHLAKLIGKGGEGEIYTLSETNDLALKLYTVSDKTLREKKITEMISLSLSQQTSLVSFPTAIARSVDGQFVGFVMRLINDHKPLHDLYSPGSRKIHFPHADYRFLVRSAGNIARAIASVHKSGCVIGDINHSSMLISPKGTSALIDADSYQIISPRQKFLCQVGVPEYTPPEIQGQNFSTFIRNSNHDAFGLAIVIFQLLLMGRHPFVGTVRSGEIPPLHENIKNFRYVYSDIRNVGMDQPPGTPSIKDFSQPISDLFENSFSKNGIVKRPTAIQWISALDLLEKSLVKCDVNSLHYFPGDAADCPWCEMENQLTTILFLPFVASGQFVSGQDPGALNFNLDLIWKKIEAIKIPSNASPQLTKIQTTPSPAAINSKPVTTSNFNSLWAAGAGVILLFIVPVAWFIWIFVIFWGISKKETTTEFDSAPFIAAYKNASQKFQQEIDNWQVRTGFNNLISLKTELLAAKEEYLKTANSENQLIKKYRDDRRVNQMQAFLDGFDISSAKIKGIGPAKLATLASYGIDTAADISTNKILAIPGFGPENSKPIFAWRNTIERRFIYQQSENLIDKQEILKIRNSINTKLISLRQKLNSGPINLNTLAHKVNNSLSINDPALQLANKQLQQARTDLLHLQLTIPATNHIPSYRPQTPTQRTQQSNNSAVSNSVLCPKCNTSMVKRKAKKGRNAGSYFWGCNRYPLCKGTRNI